ncbi:MAG: nucleoside-diphosphate kinase [Nocardioides sp.]|uniref:nucleoside-diphosphate kinase n=1 Tax=Nocardioides sp. TaxID=35761 RepID=UPI0039E2F7CC
MSEPMSLDPQGHPWDGYAFALICPDAVVKRAVTAIITRFVDAGFTIVRCNAVHVTPGRSDEAFGIDVMERGDPYRFRLLDSLFDLGPSVALVVRDDQLGHSELGTHERLRRLKGATDPAASRVGTVRWDFGGVNVLLGLLHTADTPARSAWEATTLAPELGLSAEVTPVPEGDWRTQAALCDTGHQEIRDFDAVLLGLRSRVLVTSWHLLPDDARLVARDALVAGTLADIGTGARIARDLPAGPTAALLRAEWRPGLPGLDARALRAALIGVELTVDPWEQLVLTTSAAFAPRSQSRRPEPEPEAAR